MDTLFDPRFSQLIVMSSGLALIMVGLVLTVLQFSRNMRRGEFTARSLSAGTEGVSLSTTYVGLILVAIGALLEAVGYAVPHFLGRVG